MSRGIYIPQMSDELIQLCNDSPEHRLLNQRFYILGVAGTVIAVFGFIANGLLGLLFLTRSSYRHSPFFFLGFVALFDTLLDATFLLLLPLEVSAEYYDEFNVYETWLQHVPFIHLSAQIFRFASVVCLIMASIERYCMTKHWTFVGFEMKTRWVALAVLVSLSVCIKYLSEEIVVEERSECKGYRRWSLKVRRGELGNLNFFHSLTIFINFFTLIFLNGGIVYMLSKQNVQQLRSLITELTLGHDLSRIRKKNLRSATRTLIVIISAYLISNLLSLLLILSEYIDPEFLSMRHPDMNRMALDMAALLTVLGNAIRCPAHVLSNSEIRSQFKIMFCGEVEEEEKKPISKMIRRKDSKVAAAQEKMDNPWMSLLWVRTPPMATVIAAPTQSHTMMTIPRSAYLKRHSAIAIL